MLERAVKVATQCMIIDAKFHWCLRGRCGGISHSLTNGHGRRRRPSRIRTTAGEGSGVRRRSHVSVGQSCIYDASSESQMFAKLIDDNLHPIKFVRRASEQFSVRKDVGTA